MTRSEGAVWAFVALGVAGVLAFAVVGARTGDAPRRHDEPTDVESAGEAESTTGLVPAPYRTISDLPAVERSGRAMRTADLRGKFVVLDLIYTTCGWTCPQMTHQMAKLQDATHAADDVRLVSVSVDPDNDTPQALTAYAKNADADPAKWLFLRLSRQDVTRIAFDDLKLVVSPDEIYKHSSKFVLFDRDLSVRGLYDPLDDVDWKKKLLADLATLRRETPGR